MDSSRVWRLPLGGSSFQIGELKAVRVSCQPLTKSKSTRVRSEAFRKTSRLLGRADFLRVMRDPQARLFRGKNAQIFYLEGQKKSRLGISIAKKFVKRANDRNRIRRCLKEFFRREARAKLTGDVLVRWTAPWSKMNKQEMNSYKLLVRDFEQFLAHRKKKRNLL